MSRVTCLCCEECLVACCMTVALNIETNPWWVHLRHLRSLLTPALSSPPQSLAFNLQLDNTFLWLCDKEQQFKCYCTLLAIRTFSYVPPVPHDIVKIHIASDIPLIPRIQTKSNTRTFRSNHPSKSTFNVHIGKQLCLGCMALKCNFLQSHWNFSLPLSQ